MPGRQVSWLDSPKGPSSPTDARFRVPYTFDSASQEEMGVLGLIRDSSSRSRKVAFHECRPLAKD